uniref:Uncharacterized protein n=1 Tax=Vespula pensylvanica TaxID=30213 RepID=A0A834NSC4_VESPE|nr:hypothetical protein H0235_011596 [Vespula pensylvanica]
MVVLPPSSSLFWKGKEDLDGKRAGGRNYDRRPVASLTDDASLRSRLRAQKDGTTVLVSLFDRIQVECFHDAALDIEMVSPMPSITRLHTTMHMDLTSFRSSGNIMDSENHTNFTPVNELQCREHIDIVHEPRLILEPVPIAKVFPGK